QQLDTLNFDQLPLRLIQTIQVRQEYTSKTPYFQQVKITDAYTKGDQEKVVRSRGVNKIQNGELWCVIVKPDETVIHSGKTEGQHTIIWQRSERNPLKIEYFREKVEAKTYTIVGWGYYGDDDPALTPRLWFRGVYHRVN
ncbi:MAG: hypothetical protein GWN16_09035, partial [Calditrichae bacterium]|nr:hypothetical protein [Calditrichia bacterium]NIW79578.1 hypothetical protein [Calditrichia bacterium]